MYNANHKLDRDKDGIACEEIRKPPPVGFSLNHYESR
ncbi:excalibur calcium-binding domain-containing protein [Weizmannia acidilactici]